MYALWLASTWASRHRRGSQNLDVGVKDPTRPRRGLELGIKATKILRQYSASTTSSIAWLWYRFKFGVHLQALPVPALEAQAGEMQAWGWGRP